jgi:hypothetical protein
MEEETPPWLSINKLSNKFGEKVSESMDVDLYNVNCLEVALSW